MIRKGCAEWSVGAVIRVGVVGGLAWWLSGCSTVVPAPVRDTPTASQPVAPVTPPPATTEKTLSAKPPKPTPSRLTWTWPLPHEVGVYHPKDLGADVVTRKAVPVVAVADGVVSYVGDGISTYGLMVIIKHPDDYVSVYAQNSRVLVRQGQVVTQGQKIAMTGTNSNHGKPWHFEIRHAGKVLDPRSFFPASAIK